MQPSTRAKLKLAMQIAVSLAALTGALIVILVKDYPDDSQKWAFGMVGVVVGYWLR